LSAASAAVVAHREGCGLGPAQHAAQKHGWRVAQPDAGGPFQRQPPVAACARVRMGMRAGWKAPASMACRAAGGVLAHHSSRSLMPAAKSGASRPLSVAATARTADGDARRPEGTALQLTTGHPAGRTRPIVSAAASGRLQPVDLW